MSYKCASSKINKIFQSAFLYIPYISYCCNKNNLIVFFFDVEIRYLLMSSLCFVIIFTLKICEDLNIPTQRDKTHASPCVSRYKQDNKCYLLI